VPAPFYNAIKGTTAGTPGTGAFTPNAASSSYSAWSTVPAGWIGLVRFDDGSAWELAYCYWNGTTLSRASTQLYESSTGSQLTLTSSATAAMVADANEIMNHIGTTPWRLWQAIINSTTISAVGIAAPTVTGTAAALALNATNYHTQQPKLTITSATTANAQAGVSTSIAQGLISTTATFGGVEMVTRVGASVLPTGYRLFFGMSDVTYVGSTAEPSALVANVAAFAKDSTDTNIQLLVNNNSGGGTKIDTGIPFLATSRWFEAAIWIEPGTNTVWGLLIEFASGSIWIGSTTVDVPATGALMAPQVIGGLSSTTGTAFAMRFGSMSFRNSQ
jgi:hypothetical protein